MISNSSSKQGVDLGRHVRARLDFPGYPKKFSVAAEQAPWSVPFAEYAPVEFTHARILEEPEYADPIDVEKVDFAARRFSMEYERRGLSELQRDRSSKRPLNPSGRTGMTGRGRLGRWGANVAADMLVWRRCGAEQGVFEIVAIVRGDTGICALPGGFVDDQESFREAAIREFFEEASAVEKQEKLRAWMMDEAECVYSGGVDDNRATDNAWTETSVFAFEFDEKRHPSPLELKCGDDAVGAKWIRTDSDTFQSEKTFHCHHQRFVKFALQLKKT